MKRACLLTTALTLLFSASCSKVEIRKDLLKEAEPWIDMTQHNRFNPSKFTGDWVLNKVTHETYVDGNLTASEDYTSMWATMEYSFYSDGTMYYGTEGRWTYAHNFLIWECWGSLYSYETVDVSNSKLILKGEEKIIGIDGTLITFYKDKSGTHYFNVFEYKKK